MLNLHALLFGAHKITRGARQHPLYKRALAAVGMQPDDDGTYRHLNPDSPWNYVPESPNPSLIDVYHRQYDFNVHSDVDTTNTWTELKSGAESQLARNNYTPSTGNANVQAGPNADDYAWYQERYSSIHVPFTGSTLSAEANNIWFEVYAKTDTPAESQWFVGFSQEESSVESFRVPTEGFGFYLGLDGFIYFTANSGGNNEEEPCNLDDGSNNRLQFHAYLAESENITVDGLHVFMVIEVFSNGVKRDQITLNDAFPYDTDLYLTIFLKTTTNSTQNLRLFHLKQLNEKPGT